MDPRRLADIRAGDALSTRSVGSGYLVAPQLVLTARHSVSDAGTARAHPRIDVRIGHPRRSLPVWRDGEVCWVGPADTDVALVWLEEAVHLPGAEPVRWGHPTGRRPLAYEGLGYPQLAEYADDERGVETLRGVLAPLSTGPADTFVLDQAAAPRPRPEGAGERAWSGVSGAAVFCHGFLVGVVVRDDAEYDNRRLHACPTNAFVTDTAFVSLLSRHGEGSPRVEDIPEAAVDGSDSVPSASPLWPTAVDSAAGESAGTAVGGLRPAPRDSAGAVVGTYYVDDRRLPLRDARQAHDTLMDSALQGMVWHRGWLAKEIEAFISEHDSGYFVIEGDAGIGKSVFAAWLARTGGHPVHFTQLDSDAGRTEVAVPSLTAQLIEVWGLSELAPGGLLPQSCRTVGWLAKVLRRAAQAAADRGREEAGLPGATRTPVVLVVDALDAAVGHSTGFLPLGLPGQLPDGVYVVATVRTGGLDCELLPDDSRVLSLTGGQCENQADLHGHLTKSVAEQPLATKLAQVGVAGEAFVASLLDRSRGIWIYVRYVLDAIEREPSLATALPDLPIGLDKYYARQVRQWCDGADGDARLRLVVTFAVLEEPADASTLAALAAVDHAFAVSELTGRLRPFASAQSPTASTAHTRFSPAHSSLREYLITVPEEGDASARALRERTAYACRQAHDRIVDHYFGRWGGLAEGLPELGADPGREDEYGGYALRHLTHHLLATGRTADLHALLRCGTGEAHLWYAAHEQAGTTEQFLNDVERAARHSDSTPQLVRYALIKASIAAVSTNCPPAVLDELVRRGLWSASRALTQIAQMTDEQRKAEALTQLAPRLPGELFGMALALAAGLREAEERSAALYALVLVLPDDRTLMQRAIRAVCTGARPEQHPRLFVALAQRLPVKELATLRQHPAAPSWSGQSGPILRAAVTLVGPGTSEQLAERVLALARQVDIGPERCRLVEAMVPHLPPESFDAVIDVLRMSPKYADDALVALARRAPTDRIAELCAFAADPVHMVREARVRLAEAITARNAQELLPAVMPLVKRTAAALAALAPLLNADEARALLDDLRAATDDERGTVIAALAPRLPAEERDERIRAEVEHLRIKKPLWRNERALAPFAQWLDEALKVETVSGLCRSMSLDTQLAHEKAPALRFLAPHLGDAGVETAFDMMLRGTAWSPDSRLLVADILAPHLSDRRLLQALRAGQSFPLEDEAFTALAELGTSTGPEASCLAQQALEAASGIEHERQRVRAVAALTPILTPPLARTAQAAVASIGHPAWMAAALERLAPVLPAETLAPSLQVLISLGWKDDRGYFAETMPEFFTRLAREGGPEGIPAWLDSLDSLDSSGALDAHRTSDELYWLAPHLTPTQAQRAWSVAERLEGNTRAEVLAVLALRLPAGERPAAVDAALRTYDHESISAANIGADPPRQLGILPTLARAAVTDELLVTFRTFFARELEWGDPFCERWLAHLAPALPECLLPQALDYALAAPYPDTRAKSLVHLAPRLSGELLKRALAAMTDGSLDRDVAEHAQVLTALAARLPARERAPHLDSAAGSAAEWPWKAGYRGVYTALIPMLSGERRREAVDAAQQYLIRQVPHKGAARDEWTTWCDLLAVLEPEETVSLYTDLATLDDPTRRTTARVTILRTAGPRHRTAFGSVPLLRDLLTATTDRAGLLGLDPGS
ncbi:hypothetical protein ACFWNT_42270 [Streptomyces sp. NPDC058409]|uniref:hypothetical protein n=1 Tax=Streptomyces sp. NPDC058409 TaxID=3346484 RepID=UPI00365F5F06